MWSFADLPLASLRAHDQAMRSPLPHVIAERLPAIRPIVRVADLGGTLLFAVEGALAGAQAHFDPVGIVTLAFVVALGGGVARDAMLGLRAAAIDDWHYAAIVLAAVSGIWLLYPLVPATVPPWLLNLLDAAGLGLFAVAGTDKALANRVHALPAMFVGTLGAVGGGVLRDLLLGHVPRILYSDIYASAAFLAAAIVVSSRSRGYNAALVATIAWSVCFAVRIAAFALAWRLPPLVP